MTNKIKVDVLVPVYREEEGIEFFHQELTRVINELRSDYDLFIYYLVDRSEDLTEIKLSKIARQDSRVKVIVFGKAAGHQMALMAGLKMSRPDATTVMLDGDMQHPPALIPVMIQELGEEFQIVQSLRKVSVDKRLLVRLAKKYYYRVFSKLAGVSLESGFTDFRVVSPEAKKLIAQNYLDKKPFIRGYLSWLDLPTKIVEFEASPRSFGKTNFSFRRLASMATSGILNFSVVPLKMLMRVGTTLSILAILTAFFLMALRLMDLIDVPGYASISISIFFFAGVQLFSVGLLGVYVSNILVQVQNRPDFVVQSKINFD